MTNCSSEAVIEGRNALGEGPLYDARSGSLFWIDIEKEEVFSDQARPVVSPNRRSTMRSSAIFSSSARKAFKVASGGT